jgi:hypothetical protein
MWSNTIPGTSDLIRPNVPDVGYYQPYLHRPVQFNPIHNGFGLLVIVSGLAFCILKLWLETFYYILFVKHSFKIFCEIYFCTVMLQLINGLQIKYNAGPKLISGRETLIGWIPTSISNLSLSLYWFNLRFINFWSNSW